MPLPERKSPTSDVLDTLSFAHAVFNCVFIETSPDTQVGPHAPPLLKSDVWHPVISERYTLSHEAESPVTCGLKSDNLTAWANCRNIVARTTGRSVVYMLIARRADNRGAERLSWAIRLGLEWLIVYGYYAGAESRT